VLPQDLARLRDAHAADPARAFVERPLAPSGASGEQPELDVVPDVVPDVATGAPGLRVPRHPSSMRHGCDNNDRARFVASAQELRPLFHTWRTCGEKT
jgi:hypothetical protein